MLRQDKRTWYIFGILCYQYKHVLQCIKTILTRISRCIVHPVNRFIQTDIPHGASKHPWRFSTLIWRLPVTHDNGKWNGHKIFTQTLHNGFQMVSTTLPGLWEMGLRQGQHQRYISIILFILNPEVISPSEVPQRYLWEILLFSSFLLLSYSFPLRDFLQK